MNNLAVSYAALGRQADALKLREQVLALRKVKLGQDHPDTLKSMNTLALSYEALGRPIEALKLREEALALMKARLGPDHPDTLLSMGVVAESSTRLFLGQAPVPLIDECVRRAAGRDVHPQLLPRLMALRLRHFQLHGDAAGCRATAEMWEGLKRTDADSLYNAARFRALTAAALRAGGNPGAAAKEADAEDDRAMEWLRQAVAAGYKDAAHIKQDRDLYALRGREDFQKLLAGLEAGQGKDKK
jgi:hypothetical protein